VDFLSKNIRKIQAGVQHHNRTCGVPARAILMHPAEQAKLGVEKLWGLPICADERVRLGRFRIDCEGSAWRVEDELELYTQQLLTVTLPELPGTPLERPLAARA
jgi:hypothetical protein